MNAKKLLFVLFFLVTQFIVAQIKIGDNPQNLDPASVLELESNSRVLVITRISALEMNAITPLPGAIIYNTDDQCLFYFDGTSWINLCNSFGLTIANTVAGNRIATLTQSDGSSADINETITSLADIGDGNVTYTKENGIQETVAKANIIDNGDGTYTFTNNDGSDIILDTRASSNTYNNATSGLTATDVQAAIDEVVLGSVDDQNLTGASLNAANILQIDIENGTSTTVDLSTLDDAGTDDQNISGSALVGTNLTIGIENGTNETIDLSSLASMDDQNIAGSALVGTILTIGIENGTNETVNLASLVDDADADPANEVNTAFAVNAGNLDITDSNGTLSVPVASLGTDDQDIITDGTAGNITIEDGSTLTLNVDDADADPANELNTTLALAGTTVQLTDAGGTLPLDLDPTFATDAELAGLNTDDADADPANELNTSLALAGTTVQLTDAGGTLPLDLDPTFATDAELAGLNTDDADADPANELNTSLALAGTTVQLTDAGGTLPLDLDPTFATDAELAGLNTDDADADPANELNTSLALAGTTVQLTDAGGTLPLDLDPTFATDAELAALNTDDADADPANELNTTLALAGTTVQLTDAGGTLPLDLDPTFATDAELAALNTDDADADPANENQTVSAGTGINVNQVGQNFEVVNVAPDQTVTLADGGSGNVTIGGTYPNLTVDVVSLNDADSDPTNENQTVSAGTGINVNQVGQNFEVINAAPDQTVTLADGGNGNVTIGGTYPNLTVDVPDNNDNDPTNENQTVSAGSGINVNQVGQNFEVINAAPDQTVTLADGGNGNVTIGGTYPNLTVDVPDNNDNDSTNELQTAAQVTYDPLTSGLAATDTQEAIDEIAALNPGANLSNQNLTQTNFNRTYNIGAGYLNFSGTGNLGVDIIGAPVEKFEVNGKIRSTFGGFVTIFGSGGSPSYSFSGDTGTGLFRPLPNQLGISTGGFQAMRIDDNQNVGIQQTSPTSTLHVSGSLATAVLEGSGVINLDDTHHTVLFTANGSIVLPSAALSLGRIYIIKNSSFTVGSTSYLDGSGTAQTTIPSGGSIWLQSIGGNWHQIN